MVIAGAPDDAWTTLGDPFVENEQHGEADVSPDGERCLQRRASTGVGAGGVGVAGLVCGVARPCGARFTDGGAGTDRSNGPRVHRCRMPFRLSTRRRGRSDGHLRWSARMFKADRSAGAQAKAARLLALFG
jgi:hypothetical protein